MLVATNFHELCCSHSMFSTHFHMKTSLQSSKYSDLTVSLKVSNLVHVRMKYSSNMSIF